MAVVVITGSNSGIGRAAALAFAEHGDTVYATMRDITKAGDLQTAATGLKIRTLDVTQPDGFASFVEQVVEESGRIDVLLNNAGILKAGAFEDLSTASFRQVMETNCFGPMLLTRTVLPQMRAQRSGYVIMMSSLSGVAGLPGDVAYTASKFALEGATEALRHEVDRWNIKVALVQAGLYATGIFGGPDELPEKTPYRPLIQARAQALAERLPQAYDPKHLGQLFVKIASSDGSQLRWPADEVAQKVLATLYAQDDRERDAFLREVAGTDWWSEGEDQPRSNR